MHDPPIGGWKTLPLVPQGHSHNLIHPSSRSCLSATLPEVTPSHLVLDCQGWPKCWQVLLSTHCPHYVWQGQPSSCPGHQQTNLKLHRVLQEIHSAVHLHQQALLELIQVNYTGCTDICTCLCILVHRLCTPSMDW
ncbi:hypothetical protein SCLCIDRAFT_1221402 [Scleroderma citrinum Foug A]|uniref:Uncharacterized protein n=1 Tax=Scleroderma citrinum Foug A TaxID=1036808 RepID=A0A0C3D2V8_9AGAM|nr:hypothetical protein SCLCIDRAFT_1221402 [Scleroderma citrinum Foug A]